MNHEGIYLLELVGNFLKDNRYCKKCTMNTFGRHPHSGADQKVKNLIKSLTTYYVGSKKTKKIS